MEPLWSTISEALGLQQENLSFWQMALRAVIVYVAGVVLVRLGEKRFIGKFSAFDIIMGIMIGSLLSRAITTAEGFVGTLSATSMLVLMHYTFATLAYHFEWFRNVVKGSVKTLVLDGEIQWDAMRRTHLSEQDLKGALRENASIEDLRQVKKAFLERSGNVSAILSVD